MLSALAVNRKELEKIFQLTPDVNVAGIYAMKLMINGESKTVFVDDYIPVTPDGQPAFSSSRSGNVWVLLLEKAWAKLNGSYESIISGRAIDVFTFLTPYPTKHIHTDEKEIWEDLQEARINGYMMTCGTGGNGQDEIDSYGLVSNHAYSVLGVHFVKEEHS